MGATSHNLLVGFECHDQKADGACCSRATLPPLDHDDSVHGAPEPAIALSDYFGNITRTKAVYRQDYVE